MSRSGQLQEQGFSVEVAERIAAPQRSSTRIIYKSKWALFEKCCRENSVDFSTPSVKQGSKQAPFDHRWFIGWQLLTPWAQPGSISPKVQTLTGYSPLFTRIVTKIPEIFLNGTFLLYSMTRYYTVMVHSQHRDPVNTKRLFFLDVGRTPAASREIIQFHMVSL